MIFKAPDSDGRIHEATIEGKKTSLFRSTATPGHTLVINVTDGHCRTIHDVTLVNGQVDLDSYQAKTFNYETFLTTKDNLPYLGGRPCAIQLGVAAILSQFPEILPVSSPAKSVDPDFFQMIWREE